MLIEISTFRPAEGVDDDALLAADKAVQEDFVYHQPGLVRRTTARGEGGAWAVVTLWGSAAEADAAAERAGRDRAWTAFEALVDGESVETRRYETLD